MTTCCGCGSELSGGLDTFGPPHAELCYTCFFSDGPIDSQVKACEEKIKDLEEDLEQAESELEEAENQVWGIRKELRDAKAELKNKKPVSHKSELLSIWIKEIS